MKKQLYLSPHITFTDVEQEGLICTSVRFNLKVQELENINDKTFEDDETPEEFYFKS